MTYRWHAIIFEKKNGIIINRYMYVSLGLDVLIIHGAGVANTKRLLTQAPD